MPPELKSARFRSLFLLSLVCLAFAFSVMLAGQSTQQIQIEIQSQHDRIDEATGRKEFLQPVLRDASEISLHDPSMADFLTRHRVTLDATPEPPKKSP